MSMPAVRLRITGRVQGVGYRAWVMRAAARLGLRGWVRNRADGSVEALVIGDGAAVAAMLAACRNGPPAAIVADVALSESEDDGSTAFTARPTV
jgi:acylphosphatase